MRNFKNLKFAERGRENWVFSRIGRQRLSGSEGAPETEGVWGVSPKRAEGERQPKAGEGRATIGIPRALFYWKRPYFWETFFENLGFEVLLSPGTNKEIIERGVKIADSETCFSMKVFYGHVLYLDGKVDFIFIPRLKKNELGLEYCPKFFALPDLLSLSVKTPIVSAWIDLKKENFKGILLKLAKDLGKGKEITKIAIEKSLEKEKIEKEKIEKEYQRKIQSSKKRIILISHPYNLYDEYVNLRIQKKIEDLGGEVIFIDEVQANENLLNCKAITRSEATGLLNCGAITGSEATGLKSKIEIQKTITSKFHWEFGQEILSQTREIIKNKIQGAIEISAFQCGCDAVLKEFIEQEFKKNKTPFLYLLIDEQTGEAGLQTRLEAFFDTLS